MNDSAKSAASCSLGSSTTNVLAAALSPDLIAWAKPLSVALGLDMSAAIAAEEDKASTKPATMKLRICMCFPFLFCKHGSLIPTGRKANAQNPPAELGQTGEAGGR